MIPAKRLSSFVSEKLKHLLVWVGEGGGGGGGEAGERGSKATIFIGPWVCVMGRGEGERGSKATMFISPHVCVLWGRVP